MAEAGAPSRDEQAFARLSTRESRVHILDLAGFSSLTEQRVAEDPKRGLEAVSQLVTRFFSALSARFSDAGIVFGSFAGDALIAPAAPGAPLLSAEAFRRLAQETARAAGEPLSFRTGLADGLLHEAEVQAGGSVHSLTWGPAVSATFLSMRGQAAETTVPEKARYVADPGLGASASVAEHWSLVLRLLDPAAAATTAPGVAAQLVSVCAEIAESQGALMENAAQDDKGLILVFALLRGSEAQANRLRETLLGSLRGLGIFASAQTAHCLLFHCQPYFSGTRRRVVFGAAINRAAKALMLGTAAPAQNMTAVPSAAPQGATFVGRSTELARLDALADRSRSRPVTACLSGPAGIGKSAIVREFISTRTVSHAHAELAPIDAHIAFSAIRRVAEACSLGANLVPTSDAIERLSDALPPVLVVENWHWCDPDSRRLLAQLFRSRSSGLMLLTSRAPAAPDEDAIDQVAVGPLDAEAARALLAQSAPALSHPAEGDALIRLAEGSPFWLIQAGFSQSSEISETELTAGGFEALLSLRARKLSVQAISLWRVHCAWRTWLKPGDARSLLAELGLEASGTAAGELKAFGWLEEDPVSGLRPAHDILADWGTSDLPSSFEQALHHRLARRLKRQGAPAARTASHWERAGARLRAASLYEAAAREAASLGAHAGCLRNLEQAQQLAGGALRAGSARAARQLALSALAHWGAGRLRRAEHFLIAFDRAARELPRSRKIRADRLMAAFVRSEIGQFSGNSGLILTGIIDGTRFDTDAPESHMARARRASFFYYLMGLARLPVNAAFERLIGDAARRGDPRSETSLRLSSATLAMSLCRWGEAERHLLRAIEAAGRSDDVQMTGTAITLDALCKLFRGDAQAALEGFQSLEDIGSVQGHQLFSVWAAYGVAESLHYAGKTGAASGALHLADERRQGLGDHQSSCIIEGMMAQLAMSEEDYDLAERRAYNALRYARRLPPSNFSTLEGIAAPAEIGARLTCLMGPSPRRAELMSEGLAALRRYSAPFVLARPRLALAEGRRAEALGRTGTAAKAYRRAGALARTLGMRFEQTLADGALSSLEKPLNARTP